MVRLQLTFGKRFVTVVCIYICVICYIVAAVLLYTYNFMRADPPLGLIYKNEANWKTARAASVTQTMLMETQFCGKWIMVYFYHVNKLFLHFAFCYVFFLNLWVVYFDVQV